MSVSVFVIAQVVHADHGVAPATMQWAVEQVAPSAGAFFIKTLNLPGEHPLLDNGLYGPLCGDEPVSEADVYYASRGGEGRGLSRMVARPTRPTARMTIIGAAGQPTETGELPVTIYTCYGGECAEREPTDPSIQNVPAALESAKAFWSQHALAGQPSEAAVDAAFDAGVAGVEGGK